MNTKKAHETTLVPQWGFGDRLRKVRTDIGYTQEEMAELLEIKAATLSSYESGRANPRATALPALAARLEMLTKVPRAWFMGWDDLTPPHTTKPRTLVPEIVGSATVAHISEHRASVAQGIEHQFPVLRAAGSNPAGGTTERLAPVTPIKRGA